MGVFVLTLVLVMMMIAVFVMAFTRTLFMRGAFVDAEFYPFNLVPPRTFEVHVKVAEVELREFPFESGRFHAEIDQRADGHVAADAGAAIEVKNFHGS